MTLRQHIEELIADSQATGYGSELLNSVTRLVRAIADEVDGLRVAPQPAPAAPAAPEPAPAPPA